MTATADVTWYVEQGAPVPGTTTSAGDKQGRRVGHEKAKGKGHEKARGDGHAEHDVAAVPCPSRSEARPAVGSITSALGCAVAGDTIQVASGTFLERVTVEKSVTLNGAGLDATTINGSGAGPVLTVLPGVQLLLSDISVTNGTDGVLVRGGLTAARFVSSGNTGNGVVLDTNEAVRMGPGLELHHNGGDGLTVVRAGGPQARLLGDRPTLRSTSVIHDNGGNGISIGTPYAGAPPRIDVAIGDADVTANGGRGIFVRDDGGTGSTAATFLDNDVFLNGAEGLFVGRSLVGQALGDGETPDVPTFAQNKFHSNNGNQVVFDGGSNPDGSLYLFTIDSPSHQCDAGANAIYSYGWNGASGFGVFAQGGSEVIIRHTQFAGGGTGLRDFSAQSGSTISTSANCTAITVAP